MWLIIIILLITEPINNNQNLITYKWLNEKNIIKIKQYWVIKIKQYWVIKITDFSQQRH